MRIHYLVLDNGKPAQIFKDGAWSNCLFTNFKDAHNYAQEWMGSAGNMPRALNQIIHYGSFGDYIEIREMKVFE